MFKTAFSTVACPDWTLSRIFSSAAEFGYAGVELRTFGSGSRELAGDPAMTASEKVRAMASQAGVEIACLATSVSFDEPIMPPVVGRIISDTERTVRRAKSALNLAAQLECPFVRVFGFTTIGRESRSTAIGRIRERLTLAADAARNTGVRLLVENGGSFCRAAEVLELIEGINLVDVSYSAAVALDAGEDPAVGLALLGDRARIVKLKDRAPDLRPCPIGEGTLRCRETVGALRTFKGWVVVEWDRLWIPDLEPADSVLPRSLRRLYEWSGAETLAAATARA